MEWLENNVHLVMKEIFKTNYIYSVGKDKIITKYEVDLIKFNLRLFSASASIQYNNNLYITGGFNIDENLNICILHVYPKYFWLS